MTAIFKIFFQTSPKPKDNSLNVVNGKVGTEGMNNQLTLECLVYAELKQ